ncbi:MAG: FAD/NAD(P)-binding oxidoreductase, partial [Actinomycetes bacterium]
MSRTIIVGGGPAGMSAAVEIARAGGDAVIIDSNPRLGGQYWRHGPVAKFSHDGERFFTLQDEISRHPEIEVRGGSQVWRASYQDGVASVWLNDGTSLTSETLLIATGAYDRSLPFPGWDLPGSMTAGGAQALLKASGALLGRAVFVAGTGPFLLPVAASLVEAGVKVLGVLEANRVNGWINHLGAVDFSKMKDAARYFKILAAAKVPIRIGYAIIEARGDGHVEEVVIAKVDRNFAVKPGSIEVHKCDAIATGWGFTPDLTLAHSLGVTTYIDAIDRSVVVHVDAFQETSQHGVFAAGESTGVGGVDLALIEGRVAGIAIAVQRGLISTVDAKNLSVGLAQERSRIRKFAQALLSVYKIREGWRSWFRPETIICRCEEV